MSNTIVTVCSEGAIVQPLTEQLQAAGYEVSNSNDVDRLVKAVACGDVQCVVVAADVLPDSEDLQHILKACNKIPTILLSNTCPEDRAETTVHGTHILCLKLPTHYTVLAMEIQRFVRMGSMRATLQMLSAKMSEVATRFKELGNAHCSSSNRPNND